MLKIMLAVRTGVVLADLVLTIKSASKESKLERLEKLKAGFKALGAGRYSSNHLRPEYSNHQ